METRNYLQCSTQQNSSQNSSRYKKGTAHYESIAKKQFITGEKTGTAHYRSMLLFSPLILVCSQQKSCHTFTEMDLSSQVLTRYPKERLCQLCEKTRVYLKSMGSAYEVKFRLKINTSWMCPAGCML